ncbi:MAG: hypothetical protein ACR2ML_00250 [Solirubrobacteraceae bacterium]
MSHDISIDPPRGDGLLAAGCLGVVAACGDDDGGSSDKNAAACKSDNAVNAGFDKLFSQTPALQSDKPPSKKDVPKIRANYDKFVAGPLAQFQKDAPPEIAGDVKSAVAGTKGLRKGDTSFFMTPEFQAKTTRIDGYIYDNCDGEKTEVKGPDYAFEGLEDSYPAGLRRFKLQNTGKEVHQMVILERKPGVTESFDQILKLPQSKAMSKVDDVAEASPVGPGKASYTSADLTKGEYIAVCFLSKGTTSLGKEGKGPPHFVLGMKKEFKVE